MYTPSPTVVICVFNFVYTYMFTSSTWASRNTELNYCVYFYYNAQDDHKALKMNLNLVFEYYKQGIMPFVFFRGQVFFLRLCNQHPSHLRPWGLVVYSYSQCNSLLHEYAFGDVHRAVPIFMLKQYHWYSCVVDC